MDDFHSSKFLKSYWSYIFTWFSHIDRQVAADMAKVARGRPITSRSSSSGSSIGQQSIMGNRSAIGDKTSSTRSRLIQPRAGSKSHSFMRPTAASVNKGSIQNLPKSIKAMVKWCLSSMRKRIVSVRLPREFRKSIHLTITIRRITSSIKSINIDSWKVDGCYRKI